MIAGCLPTILTLPQNFNSDALKFGRSISTLLPVFLTTLEDTTLKGKLDALPVLSNIGSLLDLFVSRGSQIYSGEPLGTTLSNLEFFPVVK